MSPKPIKLNGGGGPEGLIAAVIATAANDALGYASPELVADAWAYFGSDLYADHCLIVGQDEKRLPALIEHGPIDQTLRITDILLGKA